MPSRSLAFLAVVWCLLVVAGGPGCGARSGLVTSQLLGDAGIADAASVPPRVDGGTGMSDGSPGMSGGCSAITCGNGCCDGSGRCQPGVVNDACGTLGQRCRDCIAEGFQGCDANRSACSDELVPCDGNTCSGCCEGTLCFGGDDPNACGAGGAPCQACASLGLMCTQQRCSTVSCDPANCAGCCSGDVCLPGNDENACGAGGGQCVACGGPGTMCTAGSCVSGSPADAGDGSVPCGVDSCPFGCCDASGICRSGTNDGVCGALAGPCHDCLAAGARCSRQQCVAPEGGTCNAQNCPFGCCNANGTCEYGLAQTQCGTGGQLCENCSQLAAKCSQQQCVPIPDGESCDSLTCPNGCCDANGLCQTGSADGQCGSFGGQCGPCALGSHCVNQICELGDAAVDVCEQRCQGCCTSDGTCHSGLLDTRCGEYGAACVDCTALFPPSTCDISASPYVCASQRMDRPANDSGP